MPPTSPEELARAFAAACAGKVAAEIARAREAILTNSENTGTLDEALTLVQACPTLPLAITTLVAAIVPAKAGANVGGTHNATVTASGGKAVVVGSAQQVFLDGKDVSSERERTLRAYLHLLAQKFSALPSFMKLAQKGGDARDAQRSAPRLARIYVGLEVTESPPVEAYRRKERHRHPGTMREVRRVPVVREIAAHPHLVVLGEPGSGKSTLARYLCRALAAQDEECLGDWPAAQRPRLPVFVNLRELAQELPSPTGPVHEDEANRRRIAALWNVLGKQWARDDLPGMRAVLEDALARDDAPGPVFFFDGLDEVPPDLRVEVQKTLLAWTRRHAAVRTVVTCRVRSYQAGAPWRLPWPERTLEPFTLNDQVPRFVQSWFAELEATGWLSQPAGALAADLLQAIGERPELQELAPSPLLLTMMSLVHGRDERLPPGKALLYNRLVDLLLWEWEEAKNREAGQAASDGLGAMLSRTGDGHRPSATEAEVKRALAGLVFRQMHAWASDGQRRDRQDELLIAETDLRAALMPLHPGCAEVQRVWAGQVVELIRQRSGLLMEVDDQQHFGFPHKTLAEFLCAFWLCEYQELKENAFGEFCRTLEAWDDWREVGLLAAGYLARNAKGDQVLPWLQSLAAKKPSKAKDADARIIVAAEMLLEIGERAAQAVESGRTLWQQTRTTLRQIVEKGWLTPVQRTRAGRALGWMGDDRPGVTGFDAFDQPGAGFWSELIAPGPFPMGNDEAPGGPDNERPRHLSGVIVEPFVISRHPVTVAQYALFVQAGGYQDRQWWSEGGWAWREEENVNGPEQYGPPSDTPNHPQTGVSWFEASAFCAWLSAGQRRAVRLPSEAEWERAARHTDARTYPWGEADPAGRANLFKTGIGSPSPVGIFPQGKACCGALDLAGNVWEWTLSPWTDNYRKPKYSSHADEGAACVLRGGAFYGAADDARCAIRDRLDPRARNLIVGFRVVASPFQGPL